MAADFAMGFKKVNDAELVAIGSRTKDSALKFAANGYQFEAMEVGRCLTEGKTESEIMPLDETLQIMRTMDTIRSQFGLKYSGEQNLAQK